MKRETVEHVAFVILAVLIALSLYPVAFMRVFGDSGPPNPFNVRVEYCKVVSEGGWFVICVFHPANMTALGLNLSNLVLIDRLDQADRTYFVVQAPLINGTEKFLYPCVVVSRFHTVRNTTSYHNLVVIFNATEKEIKDATKLCWPEPVYLYDNGTLVFRGHIEMTLAVNETQTSRIWLTVQIVKFPVAQQVEPPTHDYWFPPGDGYVWFPTPTLWMFSFTIHSFFFWLSVVIELCLLYLWWKKEPIEDLWLSWFCILLIFLLTREPTVRLFGVDFPVYIPIFVAQLVTVIPYINSKMKTKEEAK
jgi:hypothetical protein